MASCGPCNLRKGSQDPEAGGHEPAPHADAPDARSSCRTSGASSRRTTCTTAGWTISTGMPSSRRRRATRAPPAPATAIAFHPAIEIPSQAPGDLVAEHDRRLEDLVEQLARVDAADDRARCRCRGPATSPARCRRGRAPIPAPTSIASAAERRERRARARRAATSPSAIGDGVRPALPDAERAGREAAEILEGERGREQGGRSRRGAEAPRCSRVTRRSRMARRRREPPGAAGRRGVAIVRCASSDLCRIVAHHHGTAPASRPIAASGSANGRPAPCSATSPRSAPPHRAAGGAALLMLGSSRSRRPAMLRGLGLGARRARRYRACDRCPPTGPR